MGDIFINSALGLAVVQFLFKLFDKHLTQFIDFIWSRNKEKLASKKFIRGQVIAMVAEAKKSDYTEMPGSSEHWRSIILQISLADEYLSALLKDYYNKWTQHAALYVIVNELSGEKREDVVRMMKTRHDKAEARKRNIIAHLKKDYL
ncbi:MAG: hypothetical protein Q8P72_02725 [Candidatus Roizmanbacteria bacterium]|nr:hypothetical protein [Candidatus Roizmanbacteria bacterium]